MSSVRWLTPLLVPVSALVMACGSLPESDARALGGQPSFAAGADGLGPVNASAIIEATPGQQLADLRAENAHVTALVRCDRLSAPVREACRDEADADYQMVFAGPTGLRRNPIHR